MRLLIGLVLALITPFILLTIFHLCIIFGAHEGVAVFLTVVSVVIAFAALSIDTEGFEKESSVMKLINKWAAK